MLRIVLCFCVFTDSSNFNIGEFSLDHEKTDVFIFHLRPASSRFVFLMLSLNIMFNPSLSLPESMMVTCSVVVTFESVDEILWCDHSNETSLPLLLNGIICFSIFYKTKFGNFS